MYHTIKTLLAQGRSQREIARDLGMCRKTVSRIARALSEGMEGPGEQVRAKVLDDYEEEISTYHGSGLSAVLIPGSWLRSTGWMYPTQALHGVWNG